MLKITQLCLILGLLLLPAATPAASQLSVGIVKPHANIGIHVSSYPVLLVVPGYPVYYAPRLQANLFFYDSLYWIYDNDNWYASAWYNGPWDYVSSTKVPLYVLRVPVRYYRLPPVYFSGWRQDAPPQWGHHWGRDWERQRNGWDSWDHRANPLPAPAPIYQQQYSGERYPQQLEQQQELRQKNYYYQPRDQQVRQYDEFRVTDHGNDIRRQRPIPTMRNEQGNVGIEPGTARANGGRQWDMPRNRQQSSPRSSAAAVDDSSTKRVEQMQRNDNAAQRRESPAPQAATGRAERQQQFIEPQQGRDGGRDFRHEQDSGRGRGRGRNE